MQPRLSATLSLSMVLSMTGPATAQDPDWDTMTCTAHSAYQAVNANGNATFSLLDPIKMRGVILNRPEDMLDPTPNSDPFMGGQWQIEVQSIDADDFGGTMLWMGQNIGKTDGNHPAGSYTDAQWLAEVDRVSHDPASGRDFRPGDIIEIRARAPGLFYKGKTNINEQHEINPIFDFDVILLSAYQGAAVQTLQLADLKDAIPGPTFDLFLFDATRATGAEHFQGTAIRIDNVQFVSTAGWLPYGNMTITDGTLTMPIKLGRGPGFTTFAPPTGMFGIVGIIDQEDSNATDGFKDGYYLYVMDYDGSQFYLPGLNLSPADFDQDGDVDSDDFAHLQTCYTSQTEIAAPDCRDADLNRDLYVNTTDLELLEKCESGPAIPAEPNCLNND